MRKLRWGTLSVLLAAAAATSNARGDLLVYYNFNDASNAASVPDNSGKNNSGAITVATYSAAGGGHTGNAADRAMDFGALDNGAYVEVSTAAAGSLSSITTNDKATISLWIRGNESQPSPQWNFFAGAGGGATVRQLGSHIPWDNGNIYFDVAGCCAATQRIDKNEPDASKYEGGWNHYAFVKDGTKTSIYQNGALFHDSGANTMAPLGPIGEFVLGAGPVGDRRSYNGMMDDFALWNEALSAGRIAEIAAGGAVPEPATVSLLMMGLCALGLLRRRRK